MRFKELNSWDVTPEKATQIQNDLRRLVILHDDFGPIKTIAGVDVGLSLAEGTATGGVVVFSFPELEVIETATGTKPVEFPYIPGLLAFREIPAILSAFEQLKTEPDMLIIDGQGLAHPRRFGIACHLGLLLDRPSIGCGKSRLIGRYEEPGPEPGDVSSLMIGNEQIGCVLRTKIRTNPLFISPGHRIGFESATRLVLESCRGYKLPEPTRLAHNLVSKSLSRQS
jgi:deoxyribonuclease V